jgi:hypothetical protein
MFLIGFVVESTDGFYVCLMTFFLLLVADKILQIEFSIQALSQLGVMIQLKLGSGWRAGILEQKN